MRFKLASHGTVFSTRPRGLELGSQLERMAVAAQAQVVEIDFEAVNSMSYSFADEFVGKLAARSAANEVHFEIALTNLSEPADRVISGSLERRGLDRAVLTIA